MCIASNEERHKECVKMDHEAYERGKKGRKEEKMAKGQKGKRTKKETRCRR